MTIFNYLFIGFVFTFFIELLIQQFIQHPLLKSQNWGNLERLVCIIIWPLAFIVFLITFITSIFKK